MPRRTLTRSYALPTTLAQAWAYFSDPVAVAAASSHRVQILKDDPGFAIDTGWLEQHGAECDYDLVPWRVVALEHGSSLTIEGLQAGTRQQASTRLEPRTDGVQVTSTLELRTSLKAKGSVVERLVMTFILTTGLGLSVVADQFDQAIADDQAVFGVEADPDAL